MINANNEPVAVGLKKSFGRLISHCRRHPNLKLVHLAIKGNPYFFYSDKFIIHNLGISQPVFRFVSLTNLISIRIFRT